MAAVMTGRLGWRAVLLVPAVAGCAVGPTYRRPAASAPPAWKSPDGGVIWKEAEPRDAIPRGAWWEVFQDPTLNLLEVQAVQANQELQAAASRVVQARAIARMTGAEGSPTLESNLSYDHFQRSLSGFGGGGASFTNDDFQVPLDLSYEVDLWGRVRRSFEAAWADAQARAAAYQTMLLTLTADVAQQYFALRALDTERELLRQTVEWRREALALVTSRRDAGLVPELDVARARTELATAEAGWADAERLRGQVENALAVLCGRAASEFGVAAALLTLEPPRIPAGVPSDMLERRPDVAEAERALAAANARIGVAQAAFFPVVTLSGSAGYQSAKLETVFDVNRSLVWSIGPGISIPLFAGGRNTANLRAAQAAYEEALAAYRQRLLIAFQEAEDALVNLRRRAEQAQAQAQAVAAARQATQLSDARYRQGLVSYLEVIDAERSRLQAEREAVRVLHQRLASVVLLIRALGGGWMGSDPNAESPQRSRMGSDPARQPPR